MPKSIQPKYFQPDDKKKLYALAFRMGVLFGMCPEKDNDITEEYLSEYRAIQEKARTLQHMILDEKKIEEEIKPSIANVYYHYVSIFLLRVLYTETIEETSDQEELFDDITRLFSNILTTSYESIELKIPQKNIDSIDAPNISLARQYLRELLAIQESEYEADSEDNVGACKHTM